MLTNLSNFGLFHYRKAERGETMEFGDWLSSTSRPSVSALHASALGRLLAMTIWAVKLSGRQQDICPLLASALGGDNPEESSTDTDSPNRTTRQRYPRSSALPVNYDEGSSSESISRVNAHHTTSIDR